MVDVSFNSYMKAPKMLDANGLRIIYGGLIAMLDPDLFFVEMESFRRIIKPQESFLVYDAVDMRDRPVLLLINELSQSHQRQGSDEGGAGFYLDF